MPYGSAASVAAAIRQGDLSCAEAVGAHLDRIDEVNPLLNAVVARDDDRALNEARQADDRFAAGKEVGPFHGVPITIKDSIDTEGLITTGGTEGLRDHRLSVTPP